jgi:hypothetical protein
VAPVDIAIELTVWLVVFTAVWIPVSLLVQAMLRRCYPNEAPLRVAEPAAPTEAA